MARKPQDNPQLDMTPMIDVVFELIIFFVVTIKQEDAFSMLNAWRPAPSRENSAPKNEEDLSVNIEIGRHRRGNPDGVIVYQSGGSKREIKRKELDQNLREVARTKKDTMINIKCANDSPHKALVDVLDICYRNGLHSLNVWSL